jgi:hypothetical protein
MKGLIEMRRLALLFSVLILPLVSTAAVQAGNPNPGVLPVDAHPFGHTYGEWAASWWQYVFSIPVPTNPLFDETGANCGVGQSGHVFFLVGVFNTSGAATRNCTVPTGKAIFFPVLNFECENFFPPISPPLTIDGLRALCKSFMDGATNLRAEIDGAPIRDLASYRGQSPVFSVTLPENNIPQFLGNVAPAGTYSPIVDDGVYLMLHPLSKGLHTIHFHGELPAFGGFTLDITYHLTVGK